MICFTITAFIYNDVYCINFDELILNLWLHLKHLTPSIFNSDRNYLFSIVDSFINIIKMLNHYWIKV